jgi:hypothetical protein
MSTGSRQKRSGLVCQKQIARLDHVFQKLGETPRGVECPAIDGLISEADEVSAEVADKEVLDAAIVGAAQSVEHYEIARYGTLCPCLRPQTEDEDKEKQKHFDRKTRQFSLRIFADGTLAIPPPGGRRGGGRAGVGGSPLGCKPITPTGCTIAASN